MSRTIVLPDREATAALGARLAGLVRAGDVICLYGPLGAGKTSLARGLIAALGEDEAPSPTFTLAQTYDTDPPLWHFDLYRLTDPDEIWEIGWEEARESAACLVEWPERLGRHLPADRLDIALSQHGEGRSAALEPHGESWQTRVHEF
jgi:tRNA threonylcarbamoyladenosine biosynthesis protein TsaE